MMTLRQFSEEPSAMARVRLEQKAVEEPAVGK